MGAGARGHWLHPRPALLRVRRFRALHSCIAPSAHYAAKSSGCPASVYFTPCSIVFRAAVATGCSVWSGLFWSKKWDRTRDSGAEMGQRIEPDALFVACNGPLKLG